jgi:uncharacterized protein
VKLGIDLDGVVADFAAAANEWLANHLDHEPLDVCEWDWFKNYPDGAEAWQDFWRHVHESEFMLGLSPGPYAVECLLLLADKGHDIHFVTARSEKLEEQTRRWLDKHGLHFDLSHQREKHLADRDLYLDDHIENYWSLLTQRKDVVLFVQPWNVNAYLNDLTVVGVTSWPEFVAHVEDRVDG